jgi:hypothetical protein
MWFRGVILKKANSPPRITARRGGGVTKKWREASLPTPPGRCSLSLRSEHHPGRAKADARDIFLIARPPLLAVMRGGEFAFLKMAPNLDSCDLRGGE